MLLRYVRAVIGAVSLSPCSNKDTVKSPSFNSKTMWGQAETGFQMVAGSVQILRTSGQTAHNTRGCIRKHPENISWVGDLVSPNERRRRNFSRETDQPSEVQGPWQDPSVNESCVKTL